MMDYQLECQIWLAIEQETVREAMAGGMMGHHGPTKSVVKRPGYSEPTFRDSAARIHSVEEKLEFGIENSHGDSQQLYVQRSLLLWRAVRSVLGQ